MFLYSVEGAGVFLYSMFLYSVEGAEALHGTWGRRCGEDRDGLRAGRGGELSRRKLCSGVGGVGMGMLNGCQPGRFKWQQIDKKIIDPGNKVWTTIFAPSEPHRVVK